jgi:hypothetical protein
MMTLLFFGLWFALALIRRHGDARRHATGADRARPAYET